MRVCKFPDWIIMQSHTCHPHDMLDISWYLCKPLDINCAGTAYICRYLYPFYPKDWACGQIHTIGGHHSCLIGPHLRLGATRIDWPPVLKRSQFYTIPYGSLQQYRNPFCKHFHAASHLKKCRKSDVQEILYIMSVTILEKFRCTISIFHITSFDLGGKRPTPSD